MEEENRDCETYLEEPPRIAKLAPLHRMRWRGN